MINKYQLFLYIFIIYFIRKLAKKNIIQPKAIKKYIISN